MKNLSWKPVRKGLVYCSPACGGKCTYAKYLQADADAKQLQKALGKGWKGVAFENLGWYVRADCHEMHVYKNISTYTVYLDNSMLSHTAKTPEKLLAGLKKMIKSRMTFYMTIYKSLNKGI